MSKELDILGQQLGRTAVKSLKIETALFAPIELSGDGLFADTSEDSTQADWILNLVKPAITIEVSDSLRSMGVPQQIVIAPAGVPEGHGGWMGLALGAALGAAGLFALGFYVGRRQVR